MPIRQILIKALQTTFDDLPAEVNRMPLKLWDESVFRYFFARNILHHDKSLIVEREWRKVDLAIASPQDITLVEIKFWQLGNLNNCEPHILTYQKHGGPGQKNFDEYREVVKKLRERLVKHEWGHNIAAAFVVLVYADPVTSTTKATFGSFYDSIGANWSFKTPAPVDGRVLTCKLIEVVQ